MLDLPIYFIYLLSFFLFWYPGNYFTALKHKRKTVDKKNSTQIKMAEKFCRLICFLVQELSNRRPSLWAVSIWKSIVKIIHIYIYRLPSYSLLLERSTEYGIFIHIKFIAKSIDLPHIFDELLLYKLLDVYFGIGLTLNQTHRSLYLTRVLLAYSINGWINRHTINHPWINKFWRWNPWNVNYSRFNVICLYCIVILYIQMGIWVDR